MSIHIYIMLVREREGERERKKKNLPNLVTPPTQCYKALCYP
jgi:hypothetical protein